MSYTIGVLSAYRPDECATKTCRMLLEGEVAPERITVYTPNGEQRARYRANIPSGINVIVAPHDPCDPGMPTDDGSPSEGLATGRNEAAAQQATLDPTDRWVWWFDDDIRNLRRLAWVNGKRRSVPVRNIDAWIERVSQEATDYAATLIGILPSQNALTMADDRTLGLSFCIGQVYATPANTKIRSTLSEKNDYERSVLHYVSGGGAYRVNDVSATSTVYNGEGGLQLSRTPQRSWACAQRLVDTYPNLLRFNPKRSDPRGRAEILIRMQPANQKVPRPWEWGPDD